MLTSFEEKRLNSGEDWINLLFFKTNWQVQQKKLSQQTRSMSTGSQLLNGAFIKFLKNVTSVSRSYTFSFAGTIFVYTPSQNTKGENYSNWFIYREKMTTLAGNKHSYFHSSPHMPLFPAFYWKCSGLIRQRWTSKCLFPRWHIKN